MNEDKAAINSEMRFITLELMKIAARRRQPFKQIASEFIANAYSLEKDIRERTPKRSDARLKTGWADKRHRL